MTAKSDLAPDHRSDDGARWLSRLSVGTVLVGAALRFPLRLGLSLPSRLFAGEDNVMVLVLLYSALLSTALAIPLMLLGFLGLVVVGLLQWQPEH